MHCSSCRSCSKVASSHHCTHAYLSSSSPPRRTIEVEVIGGAAASLPPPAFCAAGVKLLTDSGAGRVARHEERRCGWRMHEGTSERGHEGLLQAREERTRSRHQQGRGQGGRGARGPTARGRGGSPFAHCPRALAPMHRPPPCAPDLGGGGLGLGRPF